MSRSSTWSLDVVVDLLVFVVGVVIVDVSGVRGVSMLLLLMSLWVHMRFLHEARRSPGRPAI